MRVLRTMLATTILMIGAGCSIFTEPKPLIDEFAYQGIEREQDVTEGVSIAGFFGDISFLGEAKTPTLCYRASSRLDVDGNSLTVYIDIASSGSTTCAQTPGGLRYSGTKRNLRKGTYTVKIVQTVVGQGTKEFTQEVKL